MLGYIDWSEQGRADREPYAVQIGGVLLWVLPLGPDRRRRQQKRLEQLARRGVRTAAAPAGFPLWDAARERALYPVDPLPLRRRMRGQLLHCLLKEAGVTAGAGRVLVSAPRLTEDARAAALWLAPRVRYLALDAGRSGAAFFPELERRWGLPRSAGGAPWAEVAFGERRCPEIPGLSWCDPASCARWYWQRGWEPPFSFAGEEGFLALLYEAEKLPAERLFVKSVGNA